LIRSPRPARRAHLAIMLALLALASACSKPTAPTPELITDTFTGVLNVQGTQSNNFTVKYTAQDTAASLTVTSLRLASTNAEFPSTIGVAFGAFDINGVCQRAAGFVVDTAAINQELTTPEVFSVGGWCVQIFDAGTLTEAVNYTMVVKHY